MKTTSMRLLGAALGATAIVGASPVAANACDLGSHDDGSRALSSAQTFSHDSGSAFGHDLGFTGLPGFGQWSQHWDDGAFHSASFDQQQAAIVDRLNRVEDRLSQWIATAQAKAAENPDSAAAQRLADLQSHQAGLESLISAVQASTNPDDLKAAFEDAIASATADHSADDGSAAVPVA